MTSPALAKMLEISASRLRRTSSPISLTKLARTSRDAPILADLIEHHAVARPRILDATYGHGNIWGHLPIRHQVIKADINPELPGLDLVCSWLELPLHFDRGTIDVNVWDPLQVGDVGLTSKRYGRYVAEHHPVKGSSIAPQFEGFFDAAEWLVKPTTGIVLVKIVDLVRSGHFQWESHRLVAHAESRGWTACQYVASWSPGMRDPKFKMRYHVDNRCVLWVVLRNGPACHGPGRRLKHELVCSECRSTFYATRSDARTCPGGACHMRRHRSLGKAS